MRTSSRSLVASVPKARHGGDSEPAPKKPSRRDLDFVLFASDATDLVANGTNFRTTACVRDLTTGTTTLVSIDRGGTASGNDLSKATAVTPDGRFVLFYSDASDLVANDTNGARDVFVRELP